MKNIIIVLLLIATTTIHAAMLGEVIAGKGVYNTNAGFDLVTSTFCIPPGPGKAEINVVSLMTDLATANLSLYIGTNFALVTSNMTAYGPTNWAFCSNYLIASPLADDNSPVIVEHTIGVYEYNVGTFLATTDGEVYLTNNSAYAFTNGDRIWKAQLLCVIPTTNNNQTRIGGPLFTVPQGLPGLLMVNGSSTCLIHAVTGTYRRP